MFNLDSIARVATGALGALLFATLAVSAAVGPGTAAGSGIEAPAQVAQAGGGALHG